MRYSLKSVIIGSSYYSFGFFLTKALSFILIPIYTRLLSPKDYGIIGFTNVLIQILTAIFIFSFHGAQIRYYYEYKESKRDIGSFLFSINIFLFVLIGTIILLLHFYGEKLYYLLGIKKIPFYPYIRIALWIVFLQILNQMINSYYLGARKYKLCTLQQIFRFLFNATSIIIFITILKRGAIDYIYGMLTGNFIFFIIFVWGYIKNFYLNFDFKYVKYALLFGGPLILHSLASVTQTTIDRFILERYVTLKELGIYTLGYQIGIVLNIIIVGINRAWQPNFFELMKTEKNNYWVEINKFISIWLFGISLLCLMGLIWAKELILIFTPERYHSAIRIVPYIIFAYFLSGFYYIFSSPLFYYKKTGLIPIITIGAAIISVVSNLILVPKYGIYGAGISAIISFFTLSFLSYLLSYKFIKFKFNVKYPIIFSIFLFLLFIFKTYNYSVVVKCFISILYIIIAFIILKLHKIITQEMLKR